jgi:hypothetical protein
MIIRTILTIALFAGVLYITGCAITGPSGQAEIDTWTGATADELYLAYGTPSTSVEQADGNTLVEFQHSRLDSSTPYYCTVRYLLNPAGIVVSGTYEGNIGGCNHLIQVHQKAP